MLQIYTIIIIESYIITGACDFYKTYIKVKNYYLVLITDQYFIQQVRTNSSFFKTKDFYYI